MSNQETVSIFEVFQEAESGYLTFVDLAVAAQGKNQEEFTLELLYYIENNGRELEILEYASYATLTAFLYSIDPIAIKEVEIYICSTKYSHITEFGVKIHLTTGVIKVVAHWCLWSGSNATYIFKGLFAPLLIAGLKDKVTFNGCKAFEMGVKYAYMMMQSSAMGAMPKQFNMAPHDKLDDEELNKLAELTENAVKLSPLEGSRLGINEHFKAFKQSIKR